MSKPSFEALLPWTTLSVAPINSIALISISNGRVPFPDTWHSTATSNEGLNSLCNCLTQVHRLKWPSAKYKVPIPASSQIWVRPLMPPRSHHKDHPSPARPSDDYCCVSLQCPPGPSSPLCSLDQLPGFHEGVGHGQSLSTQPTLQISVEVPVGFLTSPQMSVICHLLLCQLQPPFHRAKRTIQKSFPYSMPPRATWYCHHVFLAVLHTASSSQSGWIRQEESIRMLYSILPWLCNTFFSQAISNLEIFWDLCMALREVSSSPQVLSFGTKCLRHNSRRPGLAFSLCLLCCCFHLLTCWTSKSILSHS